MLRYRSICFFPLYLRVRIRCVYFSLAFEFTIRKECFILVWDTACKWMVISTIHTICGFAFFMISICYIIWGCVNLCEMRVKGVSVQQSSERNVAKKNISEHWWFVHLLLFLYVCWRCICVCMSVFNLWYFKLELNLTTTLLRILYWAYFAFYVHIIFPLFSTTITIKCAIYSTVFDHHYHH